MARRQYSAILRRAAATLPALQQANQELDHVSRVLVAGKEDQMKKTKRLMANGPGAARTLRSGVLIAAALLLADIGPAKAWSGRTKVSGVDVVRNNDVVPGGAVLVRFSDVTSHQCAPAGSWASGLFKVSGPNPTPIEKLLYSQLLSARLADGFVWVGTEGCDGDFEVVTYVGLFY